MRKIAKGKTTLFKIQFHDIYKKRQRWELRTGCELPLWKLMSKSNPHITNLVFSTPEKEKLKQAQHLQNCERDMGVVLSKEPKSLRSAVRCKS